MAASGNRRRILSDDLYGLSLLVHTVTVVVNWRQLFDPWGLAKVGNHLWSSTWPTWGGFAALFVMREWDTWTVDG